MKTKKLFKTFSNNLIKRLNITASKEYFYYNGETKIILKEEKIDPLSVDNRFKLVDKSGSWSEIRNNVSLFINLTVNVSNVYLIFYDQDEKCVEQDAEVGVGLEWISNNSKIRYCKKIGSFNKTSEDICTFRIDNIEIKNPDTNIDFYWFFYVMKPSLKNPLTKYANDRGIVIAEELFWSLVVNGNSSMFPIEQTNIIDGPLWFIRCDFDEWAVDDFSTDHVAIILNKSHPLFAQIDYSNEEYYNKDLFNEVISSSLYALITAILEKARNNNELNLLGKEDSESEGSILQVIKYFKNNKDFAIKGTSAELLKTIKNFFESEVSL